MYAYGSGVAVQKNERSHLARELHDDFQQRLNGTSYFVIHFGQGERF
jgi:signal transduction histidine kinase